MIALTDSRTAAELYLAKGLAPIPLPPRSKDPGYVGWQHLRLDLNTLDQHFPAQQARNVGILNGAPSGNHLDVDLDCPQARLVASLLLPATGWIFGRKSAPGSHRIYHADRSLAAAQHKCCDLDGTALIELRGTGGQTIFPPSTHKDTGELITWERFTNPADVTLAELQKVVGEVAAAALLARHWPSKGTRQDAALALAGALLRAGWEQARAERFVEAIALGTHDDEVRKRVEAVKATAAKVGENGKLTGWPKLAALLGQDGPAVVCWVRKWLGMVKPTVAPLRQPFPTLALPAPIREYVQQAALALGTDPAYVALPALAVVASVIGNTRVIRLKGGWTEPSVVWSVIVGDSGTLKSPAYWCAVDYLFRVQKRLLAEFKQALEQYERDLAEYKEEKKDAKETGTDPGDPPQKPIYPRVTLSDITIEKIAEVLEDNPRGVLVARDELAGWLASFTRYKGKTGGSDLPHWLEMFRAGAIVVDRKTGDRRHYFVERAAASITGGIQPGVLARALTLDFLDAGGGARLIMAMPPKLPKQWSEVEIDPTVEEAYHRALDQLLDLDLTEKNGERVPHVLRLSPEAKAAWIEFYDGWAQEQAVVEGELAAAYSKLEAYAARFTLLHHVVGRVAGGDDDLAPVERESVEAGVILCRWCANEVRHIYSTLTETEEQRDTRRLVEFIRSRGGKITARQLQRSNPRKYPTAEAAEAALFALVEAELGEWTEQPPTAKGGRATRWLVLAPTPDTTDTTPDDGDEDDDAPPRAPDTTPDTTPPTPGFSNVSEGSVSCVKRQAQGIEPPENGQPSEPTAGVSVRRPEVVSGGCVEHPALVEEARRGPDRRYLLVKDQAGLETVRAALDESKLAALDVETTGLDPRADRIRLLSLSLETTDGGRFPYLVDCFAVDPAPLWEALAEKELVIHNAVFDLAFLALLGFTPAGKVHDTRLLAQLLAAGTTERVNLAACCDRYLGRALDKDAQKSDWSGTLTDAQLAYAALDVEVLPPLLEALDAKIKEAGLVEVADIEKRRLPAVVWLAQKGAALDVAAWRSLAREADEEAERLRQELGRMAPQQPGQMFDAWNWDSPQQVQQALTLAGCKVEDTTDDTLAALDHPLAELLRRYRAAGKRGGTYGTQWLAHVDGDGRVYPSWRQIGAASGRMSCSDPNMQNLPRGACRRCIVAPPGRVLVKADYSQIELRIAAKVSGDQALLDAYRRGDDLHTITARNVLGIADVTREHRQLAKALNFGLLYGMGGRGFRQYAKGQYGLDLSEAEAHRYRAAFFKSYPGLAAWHHSISQAPIDTRTLAGRRRRNVARFTEKLNTPIQGTGADGLKLALVLLWERRQQVAGAFLILAVHDEIVVEADAATADTAAGWLKTAMMDAMAPLIEPVPVEVEIKIARSWGGNE
jgi:DNA polymerase I-like protein with 3'-5' exonuclease and polymerase domains